MHNEYYTINDLEKLSGIKAHTIRIWEKRYSILNPKRTSSNIRYYTSDDLKKLMNLSYLNKHDFKISYLSQLNSEELQDKIIDLTRQNDDTNIQIQTLISATIELNTLKFEKILNTLYINRGFDNIYKQIIVPFLTKIHFLWQTKAITSAHNYFAGNIIRRKMLVAIDTILPTYVDDKKHFVLVLPDNETHEIALLYAYYKLKEKNQKISYFGGFFCLKEMMQIDKIEQADYVFTTFSQTYTDEQIQQFLEKLTNLFCGKKIIAFINKTEKYNKKLSNNILLINDINDIFSPHYL